MGFSVQITSTPLNINTQQYNSLELSGFLFNLGFFSLLPLPGPTQTNLIILFLRLRKENESLGIEKNGRGRMILMVKFLKVIGTAINERKNK